MFAFLFLTLLLVAWLPIWLIASLCTSYQRKKAEKVELEQRARWAEYKRLKRAALDSYYRSRNDFRVSRRYDSADLLYSMAVDDHSGQIWLIDATNHGQFDGSLLPYSAIVSAKVVEQSKSVRETRTDRSSQAAGILVGELLGGHTGALIGGLTARKVSTSTKFSLRIELHVVVESPSRPLWKFVFSDEALETGAGDHRYFHEQASQWEASLKVSARQGRSSQKAPKNIVKGGRLPLPAEPAYHIAKEGVDLGELPISRIRTMVDSGDLSLDQDFFYDHGTTRWVPLLDLTV